MHISMFLKIKQTGEKYFLFVLNGGMVILAAIFLNNVNNSKKEDIKSQQTDLSESALPNTQAIPRDTAAQSPVPSEPAQKAASSKVVEPQVVQPQIAGGSVSSATSLNTPASSKSNPKPKPAAKTKTS